MIDKLFNKRWIIFAAGILIGMIVLVACGAATQTVTVAPVQETAATSETTTQANTPETTTEQPTVAETEQQAAGSLLDEVKSRGALKCGIHPELAGFSAIDASGRNVGFDVDFCRAVAAAVLGDGEKIEFTQLNADQRFPALQTGEIDVLIRNTTWTLTRDADLGLDFTVTNFYDGQGYLVRKDEIKSVDELNGGTICVQSGTTTELNLADDFEARGLTYTPNVLAESADTFTQFFDGACDAVTSDKSQLAAGIAARDDRDQFVILPDTISKEPLGPVVRANDSDWRDVVAWTMYAMIQAEELGVNQENVDEMVNSDDIQIQRLLGTGEDDLGALLGLNKDWAYQVIKQVGNYGDVYARNLEPIGIAREGTVNDLWTKGGLMYSPAFR